MIKSIIRWLDKRALPDEEYLTRVRKSVRAFERIRPWLIGLHAILLFACIGLAVFVCFALAQIMKLGVQAAPFQGMGVFGFALGGSFGMTWGLLMHHSIRGLLDASFGIRDLRLLIRYHDALCVMNDQMTEKVTDSNASECLRTIG